jgi:hypothetical protein
MTSMFDYDDTVNLAFDAKIAGKKLVTAKHELLTKTGEFLFLAHTDKELAQRMQMVESDIEKVAHRKLANVSDSKAKLVRAIYEEWSIRHANCNFCNGVDNLKEASSKVAAGLPPKATADNHDVQPTSPASKSDSSKPSPTPEWVERGAQERQPAPGLSSSQISAISKIDSVNTPGGGMYEGGYADQSKLDDLEEYDQPELTKILNTNPLPGTSASDVAAHQIADGRQKTPTTSPASSAIDTANRNLSTQHGVASTSGGSGSTESSGSSGGSENKNTAPVINGKLTPTQISQNFDSSGNNQYTFAPTQGGNIPGTSAPTKLPVTPSPTPTPTPTPTPQPGNTAMGGSSSTAVGSNEAGGDGSGSSSNQTPTPTTSAPPVANEAAGFNPGDLLGTTASKINSAIAKIKSVKDINFTKEGIAVAPMGVGTTKATTPATTSATSNAATTSAAPMNNLAPVAPATPAVPTPTPSTMNTMPATPVSPPATPAVPVNEAAGFNPGAMMGTNS